MSLSASDRLNYDAFVKKFEHKRTTDDCYTPPSVFEAVKSFLLEIGAIKEDTPIVRPFFPGGDYEHHVYPEGSVVVDNPPFSILSRIVHFYVERRQPFFLFAPSLTCTHFVRHGATVVLCNAKIVYENGANICTSFIASGLSPFEPYALLTAPLLKNAIEGASKEEQRKEKSSRPNYQYPAEVVSSAILGKITDAPFSIKRTECRFISRIDASTAGIYGGGLLLSSAAAARAAAAAAAARAARTVTFCLSEREKAIVREMDAAGAASE